MPVGGGGFIHIIMNQMHAFNYPGDASSHPEGVPLLVSVLVVKTVLLRLAWDEEDDYEWRSSGRAAGAVYKFPMIDLLSRRWIVTLRDCDWMKLFSAFAESYS